MTLDEAITHLEDKIANMECGECKVEHFMLYRWLKELKTFRHLLIPPLQQEKEDEDADIFKRAQSTIGRAVT